jgi:arabinosaccharide transport system substrate-binding protein
VVAVAGGTPPDGVEVHINWFAKFLGAGDSMLAPMNDRLKGRERDLFGPAGYEPWAWQGKIYGLGNELNAALLAYSKDAFDQAGIAVPLRTYQDYADAGRKIKGLGEEKRISDLATVDILRLMLQRGGGWFDERGQPAISSPPNAEVLTWLRDATVRNDLLATPVTRPNFNVFEQINQGNLASRLVAPAWWFGGSLPTSAPAVKGLWRLTTMPQWGGRGPRTTTAGGTGAAALRAGRERDALMDFLITAHTSPAILHDFDLRNNWPTYRKVLDDRRLLQPSEFLGGQVPGQLVRDVVDEMPHWRTSPWLLEVDGIVTREALTPVLRGEKEVQRALEDAQEAARAYIASQGGR